MDLRELDGGNAQTRPLHSRHMEQTSSTRDDSDMIQGKYFESDCAEIKCATKWLLGKSRSVSQPGGSQVREYFGGSAYESFAPAGKTGAYAPAPLEIDEAMFFCRVVECDIARACKQCHEAVGQPRGPVMHTEPMIAMHAAPLKGSIA